MTGMTAEYAIFDALEVSEDGRAQGETSAYALAAYTLAAEVRRLRTLATVQQVEDAFIRMAGPIEASKDADEWARYWVWFTRGALFEARRKAGIGDDCPSSDYDIAKP